MWLLKVGYINEIGSRCKYLTDESHNTCDQTEEFFSALSMKPVSALGSSGIRFITYSSLVIHISGMFFVFIFAVIWERIISSYSR